MQKAFQEYYEDEVSHCYGCGRLNPYGLHIKSYWEEEENRTICKFKPQNYHTAVPGIVYGGLIASVIDCHATGTAAAASYRYEGREMDTMPHIRFVTASLEVNYIQPTQVNNTMILYGYVQEIKNKKVTVNIELISKNILCVKGRVIAVRMPKKILKNMSNL